MNEIENNFQKRDFHNLSKNFTYFLLLKELQRIGYRDDSFMNDYYAILYICDSINIIKKIRQCGSENKFYGYNNVIYYDKSFFYFRCTNYILHNDSNLKDCKTKQRTNLFLCKECNNYKPCLILNIDNNCNNYISAFRVNLK